MIQIFSSAQVADTGAVVSAVNCNVLYQGLENPVEIAVPGIKTDRITATMVNGTITKVANGWTVKPGEVRVATIIISVDGKKVSEKAFRVKKVPAPTVIISGRKTGSISKSELLANPYLSAVIEDFEVEGVKFTVTSFTISVQDEKGTITEQQNSGCMLSVQSIKLLQTVKLGSKVYFENIKAVGPGGERMLESVTLTIQ